MPASKVTQKPRNLDSHPVVFGHTTGNPGQPDRLAELYKLRQDVDAEIERELAAQRRLEALQAHAQRVLTPRAWEDQVLAHVARAYVVDDVEQLRGRSRDAHLTEARHVSWWILRTGGWSLTAIGELMHRDHTAVIHGVRRVESSTELRAIAGDLYAGLRPDTGVRLVAGGGRSPQAAA